MENTNSTDVQDESGPSGSVAGVISDSFLNSHDSQATKCENVSKHLGNASYSGGKIAKKVGGQLSGCTVGIENKGEHLHSGEPSIDCIYTKAHCSKILDKTNVKKHSCHVALKEEPKEHYTYESILRELKMWMEREEGCNPDNSDIFYNMIQRANGHLGLLMNEVWKKENKIMQKKSKLKDFVEDLLLKFDEMEKVFNPVCMQNVWIHFNKQQRKNIELMRKHCGEFRSLVVKHLAEEFASEHDVTKMILEKNELQEENKTLNLQLKALKEKKDLLLAEQRKLIELNKKEAHKHSLDEAKIEESRQAKHFKINSPSQNDKSCQTSYTNEAVHIVEREAYLLGLIGVYLNSHPSGASLNSVISHVQQIDSTIKATDIEILVDRFPSVFVEVPGNKLEKNIKLNVKF